MLRKTRCWQLNTKTARRQKAEV